MASKKLNDVQHARLDIMLAEQISTTAIIDIFLIEHNISITPAAISWHRIHCHERIASAILAFNRVKMRRARDRARYMATKQRARAGVAHQHKHCVTCTCYSTHHASKMTT